MAPEYRIGPAPKIIDVISSRRISTLPVACHFIWFAPIVAVSLFFEGCHQAPKLSSREVEGKHLYQARCAHCHEENDLELKKVPPDLHGVFNKKALPSGAAATDGQVRQVVLSGKGMMPAFAGRFDEAQMSALLAYLHTGLR